MFDSAKPMRSADLPNAALRPFWILAIALCFLLMGTPMVQQYQFVDGLWYGAIAKNYAAGQGSFWNLQLSQTIGNPFLGHPPLHFFLESIFFAVFGDSLVVERLYCLLTFVLNAYLLFRIWQLVFPEDARLFIFPLLLWISTEDIYLSTSFNLIECTLSVFTTGAIFFALRSMIAQAKGRVLYLFFGGIMICLGGLTKSIPAFFPLAVFACVYLAELIVGRKKLADDWLMSFSQMLQSTFISLLILLLCFLALYQYPPARSFFQSYWENQIVSSLSDETTVSIFNGNFRSHRFHIFRRLVEKLLHVIIFLVVVFILAYRKKIKWESNPKRSKRVLLFLFIALTATLPFTISLKQASYYLFPAYPFWIMAACGLVLRPLIALLHLTKVESLKSKIFHSFVILLLGISFFYTFVKWNSIPPRQKTILEDLQVIGEAVPDESIIHCDRESVSAYVVGYLARFENVSVDLQNEVQHEYLLKDKELDQASAKSYERLAVALNHYYLYKRKP